MQAIDRQALRVPVGALVHYEHRCPAQTSLDILVQQHAETIFTQTEAEAGVCPGKSTRTITATASNPVL